MTFEIDRKKDKERLAIVTIVAILMFYFWGSGGENDLHRFMPAFALVFVLALVLLTVILDIFVSMLLSFVVAKTSRWAKLFEAKPLAFYVDFFFPVFYGLMIYNLFIFIKFYL